MLRRRRLFLIGVLLDHLVALGAKIVQILRAGNQVSIEHLVDLRYLGRIRIIFLSMHAVNAASCLAHLRMQDCLIERGLSFTDGTSLVIDLNKKQSENYPSHHINRGDIKSGCNN